MCETRLKEIQKEDSENDSEEEAESGNEEKVDSKDGGEANNRNEEADIKSKEKAKDVSLLMV